MAHIGNWDWNLVTNKLYLSNETYRILGLNPQKFSATYDALLSFVPPDDRDHVENVIKEAFIVHRLRNKYQSCYRFYII